VKRTAANIAKLPELLRQLQSDQWNCKRVLDAMWLPSNTVSEIEKLTD